MKKYFRLIKETETEIYVTKDIEVPNAECVLIERDIDPDPDHTSTDYSQDHTGTYKVTHENGRTYKTKCYPLTPRKPIIGYKPTKKTTIFHKIALEFEL